ncbi:MAG TPA: hypothetical protein VGG06_24030 [Thermoanaerobaculia bacterium]
MAAADTTPPEPTPPWFELLLELRERRIAAIKELQNLRDSVVFVLWNLDELKREDYFTLADMLEDESPSKNVDLIVVSPGGSGEAGFRIGHAFQQWTERRSLSLRVIVPLYAKSAATILALGAHQIVMGLHSEIGPIDPQIPTYDRARERWRYIPAMAVLDGLKLVSEFIEKIPEMSKFFEEIVKNERLTLEDLGLLERMRESGKQYGESLLLGGMIKNKKTARETVERLSDYYKYHGHPIDAFEAEQELKLNVDHSHGAEWKVIRRLRDEFQEFVGKPDIIPGALVTTAVETASLRQWRSVPLQQGQPILLHQVSDERMAIRESWMSAGRMGGFAGTQRP